MTINKNKTTYIAGPMTGIPEWNYPAFHSMEEKLQQAGFTQILNPAKNPKDPEKYAWEDFMKDAIRLTVSSDQVVFLNGWRKSKGAKIEKSICDSLNIPCFDEEWNPLEESILQVAERIVSEDRGDDYGTPIEDFTRTGKIWAAILGLDEVPAEKVALCMAGLKISRLCHKYKEDSTIDLAGYAKTLYLVDKARKEMIH
jgi:hypothetical protein